MTLSPGNFVSQGCPKNWRSEVVVVAVLLIFAVVAVVLSFVIKGALWLLVLAGVCLIALAAVGAHRRINDK